MANTALITFWSVLIPTLWVTPWNFASYENPSSKQAKRVSLLLLEVFSVSSGETSAVLETPKPSDELLSMFKIII